MTYTDVPMHPYLAAEVGRWLPTPPQARRRRRTEFTMSDREIAEAVMALHPEVLNPTTESRSPTGGKLCKPTESPSA